ncbi:hypothetical protein E3N88_26408 [Mikania micrantha]|uniref:DUF4219 domain-containing protein n=1 Tax=Mikania micrantha TaxID=192012 RepID=A0A5N6N7G3_9ASTR|nr:hypothetical protein E3N88_26408 [Mikania micrantha]
MIKSGMVNYHHDKSVEERHCSPYNEKLHCLIPASKGFNVWVPIDNISKPINSSRPIRGGVVPSNVIVYRSTPPSYNTNPVLEKKSRKKAALSSSSLVSSGGMLRHSAVARSLVTVCFRALRWSGRRSTLASVVYAPQTTGAQPRAWSSSACPVAGCSVLIFTTAQRMKQQLIISTQPISSKCSPMSNSSTPRATLVTLAYLHETLPIQQGVYQLINNHLSKYSDHKSYTTMGDNGVNDRDDAIIINVIDESSTSYKCPLLTATNYTSWAIKMESFKDAKGIWDAIEPTYLPLESQPLGRCQLKPPASRWFTAEPYTATMTRGVAEVVVTVLVEGGSDERRAGRGAGGWRQKEGSSELLSEVICFSETGDDRSRGGEAGCLGLHWRRSRSAVVGRWLTSQDAPRRREEMAGG